MSVNGQDRGGVDRLAAAGGPMRVSGRAGNPADEPGAGQGAAGAQPAAGARAMPAAASSGSIAHADEDAGVIPAADSGMQPAASSPAAPDCVPFVMPADCTTPDGRPLPTELRCTGLYGDWAKKTPACGVKAYRPAHELWSDGDKKQRWFQLPEGSHVDAARPEAFVYPIGTQFWKEFKVEANGELRLAETRLLRKVSDARNGWVYTSYVWDGDKAIQTNDGAKDVAGTDHVVPNLDQCRQCHSGREDFILGWDPIMLGAGAQGVTFEQLVANGTLQNAPAAPSLPGTDAQALALAYLHANCGISCHNPGGDAKDSGLFMRLDLEKLQSVMSTPTFATGLYKKPWENAKTGTLMPPPDMGFVDLAPGRPDASLVLVRMQTRGSEAQMPPVGSLHVDEQGVAQVRALVE
jgi:hypothetical protein